MQENFHVFINKVNEYFQKFFTTLLPPYTDNNSQNFYKINEL
jgi:hypothetical protein